MREKNRRCAVVAFLLCTTVGWSVGWIEDGKAPKDALKVAESEQVEVPIDWEASLDDALARAAKEKKPVLIEFFQSWQQWCRMLDEKTLADPQVAGLARKFVCLRVDGKESGAVANRYEVKDYPTLVFLNSRGERIHRVVGFIPPRPLEREMKDIAQGREPEKELEKLERSNPQEFKPLVMLGVGYLKRQEWNKAIATYERALEVGPGLESSEQQEVIYSLCQLYDYRKRPETAERLLRPLLSVENSDKVKIHEMLGHICLSLRRPDDAIEHFTTERNLVEDQEQRQYLDRLIQHIRESAKKK